MMVTLHEDLYKLFIIFRSHLLRIKNVSDKSCREKQNTLVISKVFLCLDVYEIMSKNIDKPGSSQKKMWPVHIAYWIPSSTNTRSEYVIFTACPLQIWFHERSGMLRYTYRVCRVIMMLFAG
jgi:hypothetical protein